jgi:hypothetical protein
VLRVGYVRDRPPFAFRNGAGELVGMDVELAGRLGRDLGVAQVELVGGDWDAFVDMLTEGRIDLLPSLPYQRGAVAAGAVFAALCQRLPRLFGGRYAAPRVRHAAGAARAGPLTLGLASDDPALP